MGFGKYSSSSKISALVADDDTIIQKIHKALLTKLGLEVNVVANGKEVLDLYRSGTSFDLIFMDMEMPIMDGPEVRSSILTSLLKKKKEYFIFLLVKKDIISIENKRTSFLLESMICIFNTNPIV